MSGRDFLVTLRRPRRPAQEEANNGQDPTKPLTRVDLPYQYQNVFNDGVQIMSPNYGADPPEPQVVPKERGYAPPAKPLPSKAAP